MVHPLASLPGLLYFETDEFPRAREGLRVRELTVKSALSIKPLPWLDYGLNGYVGCSHSCVAGNSWIATNTGFLKPIEIRGIPIICEHGLSYNLGLFGLSIQSHTGKALATRLQFTGIAACARLTLRNGLWLDATPNHRVVAVKDEKLEWVEIRDLRADDYVAVSLGANLWAPEGSGVDSETAWVIGYLIGDGSLPRDGGRLQFAVTPEERGRLIRYFESRYGYRPKVYVHSQSEKIENLWVYNKAIAQVFRRWVDSENKLCVPRIIRESPRESVLAFLGGLWAADGWTSPETYPEVKVKGKFYKWKRPERTYLATSSSQLAHEVQLLLLNLGYKAVVRGPYPTPAQPKYYVAWEAAKQYDFIPTSNGIYCSPKSGKWYRRTLPKRKHIGISKRTLERAEPLHPLLRDDLFYVGVRSIQDIGPMPVYDLEVQGPESFAANHILCHNCSFCYVPSLIHRPMEDWGTFVAVKRNAPAILAREVRKLPPGLVAISTATDPYQYLETRYRITRFCLEVLARVDWPVSILTRSPLVLQDLDLLRRFSSARVGLSLPTLDDEARRALEPYAPSVASRLRALQRLADEGLETFVSFAPAYPPTGGWTASSIAEALADAGVRSVSMRPLDLKPGMRSSLLDHMAASALGEDLRRMVDPSTMDPFLTTLAEELRARGVGAGGGARDFRR